MLQQNGRIEDEYVVLYNRGGKFSSSLRNELWAEQSILRDNWKII